MSNLIDVGRTLRLPNIPLPSAAVLGAILLVAAPIALYLYLYPYTEATLPFRNLRGPAPSHGFFGSLLAINNAPIGSRYTDLTKEHGASTIRVRALLGKWRVVSTDITAISHVLRHTGQWYRNEGFNGFIHRMTGDNVLCVEGDAHRRQRRILNSVFNASSVNGMMPMFWEEAYALKANVDQRIAEGEKQSAEIDMLQIYIRTAMDIIGRAGFNYYFEKHKDAEGQNPLSRALNDMINGMLENRLLSVIQMVVPQVLDLPTANSRNVAKANSVEIVDQRKAEIERDNINLEKGTYEGKDVISLCLRANMLAEQRDRMTDKEIRGQIGALMLAGNETSATALTWATLNLVDRPDIQEKLRAEVLSVPDDEPSVDTLNSLPYLDNFVRELLRLDPPLFQVVRTAAVDTVIPLGKPVVGRDGKMISEVRVKKGTEFVVPINNVNRMPEIWGEDADKFNPDRYDDPSLPRVQVPGVWGGLLSFIGGPHHCLGWRFALLEIKAVLFVTMRNFKFEMLPSNPKFVRTSASIIQRSVIVGDEAKGMQMPVIVRPVEAEA